MPAVKKALKEDGRKDGNTDGDLCKAFPVDAKGKKKLQTAVMNLFLSASMSVLPSGKGNAGSFEVSIGLNPKHRLQKRRQSHLHAVLGKRRYSLPGACDFF